MRAIGIVLAAFVLTATFTPISEWATSPSEWARWITNHRVQRDLDETVRSTAFRLDTSRWLEFDIPADAVALRILTNAGVQATEPPAGSLEHPREGWRYKLDYQVLDERGVALAHQDYALRTRVIWLNDPQRGQRRSVTWFASTELIPTQTRTIQIPFHTLPRQPERIRLRLAQSDTPVREVLVRAYVKHERHDYAEPYTWSRIPRTSRQRICRATVYPPEMMSPAERRNLLRWDWSAIAPIGLPEVDYVSRRMYQREEPHTDPPSFLPPEGAIVCEPPWATTVALPQADGQVQISLFPNADADAHRDVRVAIRGYQRTLGKVTERHVRVTPSQSPTLTLRTNTGGLELLEITATHRVIATVRWVPDSERERIALFPTSDQDPLLESTAQPLRAPHLNRSDTITYDVAHINDQPTPLRITVRAMEPVESSVAPLEVVGESSPNRVFLPPRNIMFDWLDKNDRCLRSGVLSTDSLVSGYDRTWSASMPCYLTVPRSFYFSIPPHVSRVRFFAVDRDLVISAFTRPPELARKIQVPEEQSIFNAGLLTSRTWFLIRPTDDAERIAQNRCVRLLLQTPPPARQTELLAGQFEWEEFKPQDSRLGRFALTRRAPEIMARPEAVPSTYTRLEPNREYTFRWSRAEHDIPPRLIYDQPQFSNQTILVSLDGETSFRFKPRALRGEVELPLPSDHPGDHVLRVTCDRRTRLFVRCIEVEHAPQYTKRFLYEFGPNAMRLPIVKQTVGAEHVIVRPFFPVTATNSPHVTHPVNTRSQSDDHVNQSDTPRIAFAAELVMAADHPAGPLEAWTLRHRVYDVAADFSENSLLLDGTELRVDQGQRCVIPLGEDLPPGRYELILRPVDSQTAPAFVTAYRVAPRAPRTDKLPARLQFKITIRDHDGE